MRRSLYAIAVLLLVTFQLRFVCSLESIGPAFMWSPHIDMIPEEAVTYKTIAPKDLARSVLSAGGWSNLLCAGKGSNQNVDVAFVFVGNELQSLDISANKLADPALMDLLKVSFRKSNFSMAFPYVAVEEKERTIENSIIKEFMETCDGDLGVNNVFLMGSCSIDGEGSSKVADMQSIHDYMDSRMIKGPKGQADLVVVCHGGSDSEGHVLSDLITSLGYSGAKYAALYVSDPFNPIDYPSNRQIERFLEEASIGNRSANAKLCDELCQIKKSLFEGILVGIVLLIILISGLCCMMGIDTPTRFEAPQES